MNNPKPEPSHQVQEEPSKPAYQPPRIVTYTSEEILEQVGPALACTISDGGV